MPPQAFYDEIEIEDFKWDAKANVYHYPCPCGDRFEITKSQLRDGDEVARCPSCSLIVRVVYEWDDYEDYDSAEEEGASAEGSADEEDEEGDEAEEIEKAKKEQADAAAAEVSAEATAALEKLKVQDKDDGVEGVGAGKSKEVGDGVKGKRDGTGEIPSGESSKEGSPGVELE